MSWACKTGICPSTSLKAAYLSSSYLFILLLEFFKSSNPNWFKAFLESSSYICNLLISLILVYITNFNFNESFDFFSTAVLNRPRSSNKYAIFLSHGTELSIATVWINFMIAVMSPVNMSISISSTVANLTKVVSNGYLAETEFWAAWFNTCTVFTWNSWVCWLGN